MHQSSQRWRFGFNACASAKIPLDAGTPAEISYSNASTDVVFVLLLCIIALLALAVYHVLSVGGKEMTTTIGVLHLCVLCKT